MKGEKMNRKKKWIAAGAVLIVLLLAIPALFALARNGTILLNNPSRSQYPVRGVDVSRYQGHIDWNTLASNDICFAFIKATAPAPYIKSQDFK